MKNQSCQHTHDRTQTVYSRDVHGLGRPTGPVKNSINFYLLENLSTYSDPNCTKCAFEKLTSLKRSSDNLNINTHNSEMQKQN